MKRAVIANLIILSVLIPAVYGSADSSLSLNDAIAISLEHNNRYRIAREKERESDQKVREVWGELWPELGSGIRQTWWGADKGMLTGNDGETTIDIVKGAFSINPGRFYNRLKASMEEHVISVNEERKVRADTVVATIQLYYRVLLSQEMVTLRTDSVRALQENLAVVEAGYRSGSYTRLAFLRAGVALANEKTRLINATREFEQARSAFNIHLGREIDIPVVLDERTLHVAESGDMSIINMTKEERFARYNELVAMAIKNRPELIQIRHRSDLLKHREMETRSVYMWPTFFMTGTYGTARLVNPSGDVNTGYPDPVFDDVINAINREYNPSGWNKSWNFTMGATYRWGTLSPVDPSAARVAQIQAQSRQTDMELEDFVRGIKLEVQDDLLGLESASHAIQSQMDNIRTAEESYRVATLQFKNGVIDNTELLNANVELSNARTLYVQSLYEFQASKAKLNRAVGFDYYTF